MLSLLTICLSSAIATESVANITLNTDTISDAPQITMPIKRVVVYGDRGEIHRVGSYKLSKGINTIRLENIPNTVNANSIRLTMSQGKLIRLESRLIETTAYSISEVQELLTKVEKIQQEIAFLNEERSILTDEMNKFKNIYPSGYGDNEHYTNNVANYSMLVWMNNWKFLSNYESTIHANIRNTEQRIKEKTERLAQLRIESQPILTAPLTQQRREIVAVIESSNVTTSSLDLQYTVNGVSWRPTYDVHYNSMTDEARIDTSATITQRSGEHWSNVEIELATSSIRQREELPTMLTWTLGERNEYIPQSRPVTSRQQTPLYPPPQALTSTSDLESQQAKATLMAERTRLETMLSSNATPHARSVQAMQQTMVDFDSFSDKGSGSLGSSTPRTPVKSPEYYAYQMAEEDMEGMPMVQESLGGTDSTIRGKRAAGSFGKSRRMDTNSTSTIDGTKIPLALEASNLYGSISTYNSNFAISYEDGLNVKWSAPGTFDVPSDGQTHRIPIDSHQYQSQSYYEVAPALEEIAYLKAAVQNTPDHTILHGSCNIFLNGHFTSQSVLRTTKPNAMLELPLGADENIRIKRNITPMQRKEGLLKQQDITDYDITVEIGNYKKSDIQIRLIDQLPITRNDQIIITPLSTSTPYNQEKNSNGVLYWDLNIAAGANETIDLQYSISRPKDWKIWGN